MLYKMFAESGLPPGGTSDADSFHCVYANNGNDEANNRPDPKCSGPVSA